MPDLPATLREDVYQALKTWNAEASQGSPLSYLWLVEQALAEGNVRRSTNRVLLTGLEALALDYDLDASLLRLRFLDGLTVHAVANRLNAAEATVYRWQSQAVERLAAVLAKMEEDARAQRCAALEARLEPPTYANLVGVDAHLDQLAEVLQGPGPPWLLLVEGIGGIGKTSLADATLRRLIRRPQQGLRCEVGWVSARQGRLDLGGALWSLDRPALTADALLEALAVQLMPGVPAFASPQKAVAALRSRFAQRPPLVVVDNLETVADVEALLPVLRELANPAKFILTSRRSLHAEPDIYHIRVPELDEAAALALVRQEAGLRNLPDLATAGDAALRPIYETVGGNPLALRLVVGQTHVHPLGAVLNDLAAARGEPAENLYTFIYRRAWDGLDELSRRALLAMPLVTERGGGLDYLSQVSGLALSDLRSALSRLAALNLVDSRGDLNDRRYTIHGLTRSFLLEQVIRWQ